MFRIVYVSKALARFPEKDLRSLLLVARSKNSAAEVTGMLVYSAGQFLQALEGEPAAVVSTFERISVDPRHTDVKTLQRGIYTDRWFANWAMGFHSDQVEPHLVQISDRINLSALDDLSAVDFLRSCSQAQTF